MNHIKERMQAIILHALFLHIKRSLHSPNQTRNQLINEQTDQFMMTNLRMSCLLTIMVLSVALLSCCCSEAKSSSTMVVGSVYCDTCSHHYFSKSSYFLSGAMVGVECRAGGLNQNFTRVSQTNQNGEFQMRLPFSPKRHAKRINNCSVKLIHSGDPNCTVVSSGGSQIVLALKSRKNGVRTFSAGEFSFKPINLPISCSQKKKAEENFMNSVNQKESVSDLPAIRPQSPDLFPSTPLQQTPPLISLNIPPLVNLPPLMNIPIPLPSFKPVPGFGFPGIPSRSP